MNRFVFTPYMFCNNMRKAISEHPEWELKIIMIIHDEVIMGINKDMVEKAIPIIKLATGGQINVYESS